MKRTSHSKMISRRALLRGLGGAMVALPFLEYFHPEAQAAEFTPPKRLVFLTTPNGTNPNTHWPTGSESSFSLSPLLEPLSAYKDNMLLLRGVDNRAAKATGINGHTDAVRCMLTGRKASNQENDDYTAGGGISVDQYIAQQVGAATLFKSLEYVTSYIYAHAPGYCSFYDANQPVPFEDEPDQLFKRVFGNFTVPKDDPAAIARRADRQSVLAAVYKNYSSLQSKLGSADRQRLDAHLTRVKELETKLTTDIGITCTVPQAPAAGEHDADVGLDIMMHALSCDLTRVATIRTQFWDSFDNLGVTGSYHDDYLHHVLDDPSAAAMVDKVKAFQAAEICKIVDRLKAIPEGSGTLFDNTLVVWVDEFCHGYSHQHHEIPYVMMCGSNRFFQMGRYKHFTTPVSTNQLLNTLIQAMDCTGAGDFGDPVFDNTPLSLG